MTSPHTPGPTPTPTNVMLERTRRRAEQLHRRRQHRLAAGAAAVTVVVAVVVAVPLRSELGRHPARVVHVVGGAPTTTVAAASTTTRPPTVASTAPSTTVPPGATPNRGVTLNPGVTRPTPVTRPPTTTPRTVPGLPACRSAQLSATLANPSGAAGSVGYDLLLTNTSTSPCTLFGYPGVSYETNTQGALVGAPARRTSGATISTVTLSSGETAAAALLETDALNYPPSSCQLTQVTGLWVYPPGETAGLSVPQASQACADPADPGLQVGPVQPSPGAPANGAAPATSATTAGTTG